MTPRAGLFVTILATAVLSAVPAWAQRHPGPPPPPPGMDRGGFFIGGALGGGFIDEGCSGCVDSLGGLALEGHLGGMFTREVGLEFDFSLVSSPFGDAQLTHILNMAALRYFPGRFIWLKVGLGLGRLSLDDQLGNSIDTSDLGWGAMAGVGVELLQAGSFTLDVQGRIGYARYQDDLEGTINITNVAFLLGINWY